MAVCPARGNHNHVAGFGGRLLAAKGPTGSAVKSSGPVDQEWPPVGKIAAHHAHPPACELELARATKILLLGNAGARLMVHVQVREMTRLMSRGPRRRVEGAGQSPLPGSMRNATSHRT